MNSKLSIRFTINHFLNQRSTITVHYYADITYFNSAVARLGRRFNAASKKENNTEEMSIHFLIRIFLKTTTSPLILMKKNQALNLPLVIAVSI